ncbi:MAG: hypothetical protein ABL921_12340, partial [Pirellula sp.]
MAIATIHFAGCVAIRSVPTAEISPCASLRSNIQDDCCPLYDRREIAKQWAQRLNPVQLVPGSVTNWVVCQHARCV